ncbi:MAG TPA: ankyrin repeat domain-containing protein, partial [Armatimonadota bacterium]|nr:ankyrin repeat domain-containing protein [Armatimonadota bacterium]
MLRHAAFAHALILAVLGCALEGAARPRGGPDAEARDKLGRTALIRTAAWTQYDLVDGQESRSAAEAERLLRVGADVNARDHQGMTALMWAAGWGHPEVLQVLLKHHPDVAARDRRGRTALTWAARGRRPEIVEPLLEHGAREGVAEALLLGHERRALDLIAAGADVTTRGPYGETTLMMAAEHGSLAAVQALLQRRVDVNARDVKGRTALVMGVGAVPLRSLPSGQRLKVPDPARAVRPALVRLLVQHGADPNVRDREDGDTPLLRAADYGTVETIRALLQAGARVNAGSRPGRETALMRAVREDQEDVARVLLASGADPEARNRDGATALHDAAGRSLEMVQLLLSHGASVNAQNGRGDPPLLAAHQAPVIRTLIEYGADVNLRARHRPSALMWAAKREDREAVRLLRAAGAHVGLLEALYLGEEQTARRLLRKGGRRKEVGPLNETALMVAVNKGMEDVAEILLTQRIDLNAQDSVGRTALMLAVQRGNVRLVEALLRRGAAVNVKTRWSEQTALLFAQEAKN